MRDKPVLVLSSTAENRLRVRLYSFAKSHIRFANVIIFCKGLCVIIEQNIDCLLHIARCHKGSRKRGFKESDGILLIYASFFPQQISTCIVLSTMKQHKTTQKTILHDKRATTRGPLWCLMGKSVFLF